MVILRCNLGAGWGRGAGGREPAKGRGLGVGDWRPAGTVGQWDGWGWGLGLGTGWLGAGWGLGAEGCWAEAGGRGAGGAEAGGRGAGGGWGAGSPPGATGWEPWAGVKRLRGDWQRAWGWGARRAGPGGRGGAGGWDTAATPATRERFAKACERLRTLRERFANALATIPGQRLDPWTPTFKTGTLLLRIRENSQSDHNDTLNQTHKDSETILAVSDKTPCEPDP